MSDRTHLSVYVYGYPEDQRQAVKDTLREVAGQFDEGSFDDLDAGYGNFAAYEMRLGTAHELAARLVEMAPGASFYLWEDPAYEYLGDVYAYTPDLGVFSASCDSYGEPVFTLSRVLAFTDRDTDALKQLMGGPWREDWQAHSITPAPNGNG